MLGAIVRTVFAAMMVSFALSARAVEEEEGGPSRNLRVIQDNGKPMRDGMKALRKGVGGTCNECHARGEGKDSDKNPIKDDVRKFLAAVIEDKDIARREAALAELLGAMKKEKLANAEEFWRGVGSFTKK